MQKPLYVVVVVVLVSVAGGGRRLRDAVPRHGLGDTLERERKLRYAGIPRNLPSQ